jgi:hypothetical protein
MKSSLESDIETCINQIDKILYNIELREGMFVDKIVAHYLNKMELNEFLYDDAFSGPELNHISEKALMFISESKISYKNLIIVPERRNSVVYFKTQTYNDNHKMLKYTEIQTPHNILNGTISNEILISKTYNN